MPGNARGFLHWSGELKTSDLALYLLSESPLYSYSVNNTEVNQVVQAHLAKPVLSGPYFYTAS